ncbi:hypothetical protein [Micromonospora coerulea]|uniref:hypothetical protein n=1 Tax=Micromonospora coerulea TaxID=47856 RepID=UPI001904FC3F|nr:hypothetical protein [Micromonospora veneta]
MNRDDALRLSQEPIDLTGATVEREARPVRMTYSVRMRKQDEALALWLEEEADRRDLTPSDLLRELADEARIRAAQDEDKVITVRVGELHRMIDRIAERPAA